MVDKETARETIAAIAEKYARLSAKDRQSYTEEETKKDFLVPMFRALGWDMENRNEVRAEEQIGTGYADYSFRLNSVTHFYLEAKRIKADLNDLKFMKQAINYAYLKGVTWTVLSDYEQLMVFNANWEEKDPLKARFINLDWEAYGNGGFEQLWLLSRPSFEEREIDREAEKWGKKKNRAKVTDLLFADLTKWRLELFKDIRGYSETLWSQDTVRVDEAIQRFLDRLIFIRTVEDRQIEDNRLRALLRQYQLSKAKKKNLFQSLLKLFAEMDEIYNARLFAETTLDHLTVNDELLLEDIINGLYDVKKGFATYDFSAIDADVLGAVYEQYLGFKALDPKGEKALDLGKQKKRKSQGIYYTPQFVVRYIVQQTLGKLLASPDMTAEKAHKLRILDPACGSGSFLIEAFDVLDNWLAEHGTADDKQFPRRRQMRILQENIYGVDLDPQAVEVARLNLLLRAAHERELLPMLHNIKHGNSLIDDPEVAGDAAFDWHEKFYDVMEDGGFDVVIGNPPYVQSRAEQIKDAEKLYYQEHYDTASYQINTYGLFVEKGIELLNPFGCSGVIVPNYWLSTGDADKPLRFTTMIKNHTSEIINLYQVFDDATVDTLLLFVEKLAKNVFPRTINVKSVSRSLKSIDGRLDALVSRTWTFEDEFIILDEGTDPKISFWKPLDLRGDEVLSKYLSFRFGMKPYQVGKGKPKQTHDIVRSKPFNASSKVDDSYYPLLYSKNVQRYSLREYEEYIQYGVHLAEPRNLTLFHGPRILINRIVSKEHVDALYTDLPYICNTDIVTLKLQPQISLRFDLRFFLGLLASKPCAIYLKTHNVNLDRKAFPKINTKTLSSFPIPQFNLDNPTDKGMHDKMVEYVERMLALHEELAVTMKEDSDKRHEIQDQIDRLDKRIDALVYELYGLTEKEIAIVEGTG